MHRKFHMRVTRLRLIAPLIIAAQVSALIGLGLSDFMTKEVNGCNFCPNWFKNSADAVFTVQKWIDKTFLKALNDLMKVGRFFFRWSPLGLIIHASRKNKTKQNYVNNGGIVLFPGRETYTYDGNSDYVGVLLHSTGWENDVTRVSSQFSCNAASTYAGAIVGFQTVAGLGNGYVTYYNINYGESWTPLQQPYTINFNGVKSKMNAIVMQIYSDLSEKDSPQLMAFAQATQDNYAMLQVNYFNGLISPPAQWNYNFDMDSWNIKEQTDFPEVQMTASLQAGGVDYAQVGLWFQTYGPLLILNQGTDFLYKVIPLPVGGTISSTGSFEHAQLWFQEDPTQCPLIVIQLSAVISTSTNCGSSWQTIPGGTNMYDPQFYFNPTTQVFQILSWFNGYVQWWVGRLDGTQTSFQKWDVSSVQSVMPDFGMADFDASAQTPPVFFMATYGYYPSYFNGNSAQSLPALGELDGNEALVQFPDLDNRQLLNPRAVSLDFSSSSTIQYFPSVSNSGETMFNGVYDWTKHIKKKEEKKEQTNVAVSCANIHFPASSLGRDQYPALLVGLT